MQKRARGDEQRPASVVGPAVSGALLVSECAGTDDEDRSSEEALYSRADKMRSSVLETSSRCGRTSMRVDVGAGPEL